MNAQEHHLKLYRAEFDKLYSDATYSAQTYYEASKAAELFGRAIVYIPALLAAVASLLIIVGLSKTWGVAGVAAGIVSATSSFLGSDRKAATFKRSGNSFTRVRHEARMWRDTLVGVRPEAEIVDTLQKLRKDYNEIIDGIDLPANHFFNKAGRRISKGMLDYNLRSESTTALDSGTSTGTTSPS